MKGTNLGPVIIAGDSLSSSLFRMVNHQSDKKIQMPPHHDVSVAEGRGDPLSATQISIIKTWIDEGALNN